jgi:hypothetical protein
LFKQIEAAIGEQGKSGSLEGWATVEKSQTLAMLVVALRPEISCELGIFSGRSFFGLALAHKAIGHGVAVGVDPWSVPAAVEGYTGGNRQYWNDMKFDTIESGFMTALKTLELESVTKILKQKSDDVVPPKNIGVLHIDSQHTEQAIRDVTRFAPHVKRGGVAILDDLSWANDGDRPVLRAVDELKKLGFVDLYAVDDWAAFKRV